jgi:hypothetical protein
MASSEILLNSYAKETYVYNVPTTSSSLVINPLDPAGINTITWSGCEVSCIMQYLISGSWVTFSSTADITFETTGANVCTLTIDFIDSSTFWSGASPNLNG